MCIEQWTRTTRKSIFRNCKDDHLSIYHNIFLVQYRINCAPSHYVTAVIEEWLNRATFPLIFIYPVVCHRQNLDSPYMCYVFRIPLLPPPPWPIHSWFRRPKQSDLSVTSTLQSVNRWRHNEYSCCSHPSFSYPLHTHLLSRSDW